MTILFVPRTFPLWVSRERSPGYVKVQIRTDNHGELYLSVCSKIERVMFGPLCAEERFA